jgi:hypothetical protein
MKNKILMAFAMIFLIAFISQASADIWSWQDTIIDTNRSIVRHHAYYQVQDTSFVNILIQFPIPIELVVGVQDLPYDIGATYPQFAGSYVDWCNYTITWQKNEYDSTLGLTNWKIINTSLITTNTFFANTSATNQVDKYNLRARDGLIADIDCHYTNPETLFIDNVYFGQISSYVPAYECLGCSDKSFEQLTQENLVLEKRLTEETDMYTQIQSLVDKNFMIWTILSWFVKIALIFLAIALMFVGIYYFYLFFKSIGDKI